MSKAQWQHFPHQADIGVRGIGETVEQAFEQAAVALTAVMVDIASIMPVQSVKISCEAPELELLLVDWLNAIIYEMATQNMLFCRFKVTIDGGKLQGSAWGEPLNRDKHHPAVEVKGATFTGLHVGRKSDGRWVAECVVDV